MSSSIPSPSRIPPAHESHDDHRQTLNFHPGSSSSLSSKQDYGTWSSLLLSSLNCLEQKRRQHQRQPIEEEDDDFYGNEEDLVFHGEEGHDSKTSICSNVSQSCLVGPSEALPVDEAAATVQAPPATRGTDETIVPPPTEAFGCGYSPHRNSTRQQHCGVASSWSSSSTQVLSSASSSLLGYARAGFSSAKDSLLLYWKRPLSTTTQKTSLPTFGFSSLYSSNNNNNNNRGSHSACRNRGGGGDWAPTHPIRQVSSCRNKMMMRERDFWLTTDDESSTASGSFTSWSSSSGSSNDSSDNNFDDPYALAPRVCWVDDGPTPAPTTTKSAKRRHRNHPFLLRRSDSRTIVAHPWNNGNQHKPIPSTESTDHPNITAKRSTGTTVATRWH